jgi:hypothetical protein
MNGAPDGPFQPDRKTIRSASSNRSSQLNSQGTLAGLGRVEPSRLGVRSCVRLGEARLHCFGAGPPRARRASRSP